jgi:hypothetical protein
MGYLNNNPFVVSTGDLSAPMQQSFLEGASQSFEAGELVYKNGASNIVICGADPAVILGMAATAASGTTGADIKVNLLKSSYIVSMPIASSTGVVGDSDDVVEGTGYGIESINNIWHVSVADTSNDRVVVRKKIVDAFGNATSRCLVSFKASALQFETGL